MRLVFMGTPEFALPSLKKLHDGPHDIVEVVTQPDRPRGRGRKLLPSEVKIAAQELGIPVWQPESLRETSAHDHIRALQPDLIVVVAFTILPPEILAVPASGCINLHASLLPKYRGAAPIQWAIINGETVTGVSVFFLEAAVDTGCIIRQASTRIGPDETYGDLYDRLKIFGAKELSLAVGDIAAGCVHTVPQDNTFSSRAPKLTRDDARIDWSASAEAIRNRVRGTNPAPGAWTMYAGESYCIFQIDPVHESERTRLPEAEPGQVVIAEPRRGLAVATGDVPVWISSLHPPGKREMTGRAWLNGADIHVGDTFD